MSKTVSKSEETMHQRLGGGSDGVVGELASLGIRRSALWPFLNTFSIHTGSKIQGMGQHVVVKDQTGERVEKVGAGGWGGGVHLATSDERTQEVNRINLERFLKKQRKLKAKREREARQKAEEES